MNKNWSIRKRGHLRNSSSNSGGHQLSRHVACCMPCAVLSLQMRLCLVANRLGGSPCFLIEKVWGLPLRSETPKGRHGSQRSFVTSKLSNPQASGAPAGWAVVAEGRRERVEKLACGDQPGRAVCSRQLIFPSQNCWWMSRCDLNGFWWRKQTQGKGLWRGET